MDKNKQVIISLGGSLIVPEEIDVEYIKLFTQTIRGYVSEGYRFIIITGGGRICRKYNASLKEIVKPKDDDLDWLGISTTKLNAELIRICFEDLAYEKIMLDPDLIPQTDKPIIVGGGWKPGNSSDLAAIHAAISLGTKKVINLSNIDFVHDSDPKTNPDSKKYENLTWAEYRSFITTEWQAGFSSPFDPIASKKAAELGIEVSFILGSDLASLKNCIDNKPFTGTIIK